MKVDPKVARYPMLTREQQVFVSTWYNMTYAYSLDSHRVRVMNGGNILQELVRIANYAHSNGEDLWMVAREASRILKAEAVLKRPALAASTAAIQQELTGVFGERYVKSANEWPPLLDSYLREHMHLLERCYLEETIAGIETAVLTPDGRTELERFDEIRSLTGSLLSCLIAQGRSLESLFQLYSHVLIPFREPVTPYEFAPRFRWLRRVVTGEKQRWDVWFSISGVTAPSTFPEEIGGLRFATVAPEDVSALGGDMKSHGRRLFVNATADAVDQRLAGQMVHERINRVLDLVRFEYDRSNITVSDRFAIRLIEEGEWRMLPIPKIVPNPQSAVSPTELDGFARNVGALVSADRFSREGRDRVLSAFRLYRTGADTTNFENKLVNWWTALEFLGKGAVGAGGIAKAVENSVTPILMGVSIVNHLAAYRELLLEQNVSLIDAAGQPLALKELDFGQLYDVLATPAHRTTINTALHGLPFAQSRFDQFMATLVVPADMNKFLKRSEEGLRWHLQRVWRARCDIVHSAGRMVNIALLCANLEAYLKSVLTALLGAFGRIPTLASPQEFFLRTEHSYKNARTELIKNNTVPLKTFLKEVRS